MIATFVADLTRSRLDEAIDRGIAGQPLIVRTVRPGTWDALLDRAATGPAALMVIDVAAGTAKAGDALLAAAGGQVAGLAALVRDPRLRHAMFAVTPDAMQADDWLTIAGIFASLAKAQGHDAPVLAIRLPVARAPQGTMLIDDGDWIGPAEALLFSRSRRSATIGLIAEAAEAVAVEVARGDLHQLDRLLALPDHDRFDPAGWSARQPPPAVAVDLPWRGRAEPCATWLARYAPPRLRRRIWRGQVGVLFPWLAERLAEFLDTHAATLPASMPDAQGEAVERCDFEWGEIKWLSRGHGGETRDAASLLGRVRNELAHGRPIGWADAIRLEGRAKQLMAWR